MKRQNKKRKRKRRWEWAAGALLFLLGIALSLIFLSNLPGARALLAQNEAAGIRGNGDEENTVEEDGGGSLSNTSEGRTEDGDNSGTGGEEKDGGSDSPETEELAGALAGRVIVIDPGHGGIDPGKVGVHDELEKDINLSIARKVVSLLEETGATVVCTRTDDGGLYAESDSNKKLADLKARCELIAETEPDIAVSIHQNSYTDASVSGAQVFYYEGSENGEKLASAIQNALVAFADPENRRQVKSDNSYYILLHSVCPTVIVECGFLSNDAEATKLGTEEYQILVAEAIVRGIAMYFD
ncbi:MAG: N-acetylmuramoyl-L-alanine amidase [Lachnospiraceae bacterium]|nr:N-acetylmuramoyl-L-alanine amidase [Lachnospiraceae bacterium]